MNSLVKECQVKYFHDIFVGDVIIVSATDSTYKGTVTEINSGNFVLKTEFIKVAIPYTSLLKEVVLLDREHSADFVKTKLTALMELAGIQDFEDFEWCDFRLETPRYCHYNDSTDTVDYYSIDEKGNLQKLTDCNSPEYTGGYLCLKVFWNGRWWNISNTSDKYTYTIYDGKIYLIELDDCCADVSLAVCSCDSDTRVALYLTDRKDPRIKMDLSENEMVELAVTLLQEAAKARAKGALLCPYKEFARIKNAKKCPAPKVIKAQTVSTINFFC